MFEANRFAIPCEVSRTTITNYLAILEATFIIHLIRPYSTHKLNEIVKSPKIYGFDTGFVCYTKGWLDLRKEDLGLLWEHCVLNELQGQLQTRSIYYWRNKQKHEIDFVFCKQRNQTPIAIECKWTARSFDPINIKVFREDYPLGKNYVVAQDLDIPFEKQFGKITVSFVDIKTLISELKEDQ